MRDFESIAAFLSEQEIEKLQAAIDARREARAGGDGRRPGRAVAAGRAPRKGRRAG